MSDQVTGYCNALEFQCCQSGIMLGIDQSDFVQTHQVVSYAHPPESRFSSSKFFTAKAIKAITLFQFPDLRFRFGSVSVEFPYQGIGQIKISNKC